MIDTVHALPVHIWEGPPPQVAKQRVSTYTKPGIATVGVVVTGNHGMTIEVRGSSFFANVGAANTFAANFRGLIGSVGAVVFNATTYNNQLVVDFATTRSQTIVSYQNPSESINYSPAVRLDYTFRLVEKTTLA